MHCHERIHSIDNSSMCVCVSVCVHAHTHTHAMWGRGDCKLQNQTEIRKTWLSKAVGTRSSQGAFLPASCHPVPPSTPPGPNHPRLGFHQRAHALLPTSPALGLGSKGGFCLALSAVSTWRARFPEQVLGHLGPAPPPPRPRPVPWWYI